MNCKPYHSILKIHNFCLQIKLSLPVSQPHFTADLAKAKRKFIRLCVAKKMIGRDELGGLGFVSLA